MKTPRIANAIGQIDDDLVADAAKCKKKNKKHWLKWGSLAACFAVIVIVGAAILPSLFRENVTPEGTDGRYKDFSIRASESAIVWPWEYQTVYEKYRNVKIDGIEYHGKGSDDYVWEVLSECRNAPFVEDQTWTVGDRSYLSFTITSEALGVYKVALYVTEDGYLWTNAFNWQYLFNIGEDAASRIIHYAKENSTEVEYEPYRNSVAGTIIEITEEYILVDDSILCKKPADGITYKVLLNDLRISRYVDYGIVKVGDTVQISYEGEIDETSGNTIAGAISAFKATISDGDVLISE